MQQSNDVHPAMSTSSVPDGVHSGDAGVSAPRAEGSVEYGVNPGRVGRDGSFLWQMDTPCGAGMNLWSGKLSANNGYPEDYAIQAAILFEAAPELLEALRGMVREFGYGVVHPAGLVHDEHEAIRSAMAAIAKATGGSL